MRRSLLLLCLVLALTPRLSVTRATVAPGASFMAVTASYDGGTFELRGPPGWAIDRSVRSVAAGGAVVRWLITAPERLGNGRYEFELLVDGEVVDRVEVDSCCGNLRMFLPVIQRAAPK